MSCAYLLVPETKQKVTICRQEFVAADDHPVSKDATRNKYYQG